MLRISGGSLLSGVPSILATRDGRATPRKHLQVPSVVPPLVLHHHVRSSSPHRRATRGASGPHRRAPPDPPRPRWSVSRPGRARTVSLSHWARTVSHSRRNWPLLVWERGIFSTIAGTSSCDVMANVEGFVHSARPRGLTRYPYIPETEYRREDVIGLVL